MQSQGLAPADNWESEYSLYILTCPWREWETFLPMSPCWAEGWARLSCTWCWTAPVHRHLSKGCPFSQPRTGQPAGEPRTRQGLHRMLLCHVHGLPFILVAEAEKHSRTRAAWPCPLWKLRPPRTWPYIWVSNALFLLHQWILDEEAVIAEDLMNVTSTYPILGSSQILFPLSEPSSRHIFTCTVHPDVYTHTHTEPAPNQLLLPPLILT